MVRKHIRKTKLVKKNKNRRRKTLKKVGGNSRKLYPIGFSFPQEKMVTSIPNKTKLLSDLIPGRVETYIYDTEEDYYNEYKKSMFATTFKKYGWDCLRHYEIIGNGCIPYFPDIEQCPENTMTFFPKDLIIKGNALYETIKSKSINELSDKERNECNTLIQSLLESMNAKLTTSKMAKYVLEKTNHSGASNILFISAKKEPDYLRCLTLHGFKEIFGAKCHDYPKVEHIYKSGDIDYRKLYGKGITYTNLLDQSLHDNTKDTTLEEDIKNKKYDIVIYGTSWHQNSLVEHERGERPYYDLVRGSYKPEEVILMCGYDTHECQYNTELPNGHHIFVREL
jgi:hypothetical protein